jgi:hypothetical protein
VRPFRTRFPSIRSSTPALHLEEEADDLNDITVDEVHPIEVNSHSMSAQFGFFRNNASSGGSAYFAGAGLRYALTIGKMILLRRAQVQDSLAIELGAFLYKAIHFDVANDAYTILPLVGTLRYNVLLSENFGVFLYGGMVKSQVTSSAQATDSALGALSQAMPAAGGGLIFRVGPNWDARVDLGIDMIGGGLMLRF